MLRITESGLADEAMTLRLEGQVIGPWVAELQRICEQFLSSGRQITLDLSDVSFADLDGISLLHTLQGRQVALVNHSALLGEQLKGS